MVLLPFGVLTGRAMTAFAVDAIYEGGTVILIDLVKGVCMFGGFVLYSRSMAFETIGGDRPAKPDTIRRKMRAVGPGFFGEEVRHGEFVNGIPFPIQIGLGFAAGANGDVETMGLMRPFLIIPRVGFHHLDGSV